MKKIAVLVALVLLASCLSGRTKPSNFYNIISTKNDSINIKTKKKLTIGVDVVNVAGYIDRPEIVTIKNTEVELIISDFNRWAEPLSNSIQRIMAENMSYYMTNSLVRPLNLYRKGYDYVVYIYINRLDGKFGDKTSIDAWYTFVNRDGKNIFSANFTYDLPLEGDDYINLVENYNQLIAKLSERIAISISKL